MIRIKALTTLRPPPFEVYRDGQLVFATADREDAVRRLARMGVERPRHLVNAVVQWGVVDIHERDDPAQPRLPSME